MMPVKRNRHEQIIQRAVFQHIRERGARGLVAFHPANGGKRPKAEAAILKGLGVRAGVSDVIVLHQGRFFALELKAPENKKPPTEEQMQFISDVNAAGGFACHATGIDQALKVLEVWGLLVGRTQWR